MDPMEAVASIETVETIDTIDTIDSMDDCPTEPIVSIEIITPDDYEEPKKNTRIFKQKYTARWEKIEEFKDWLLPVENAPHKAFCSACKMQLASKVSILKSHNKSEKHRKILKAVKSCNMETLGIEEQVKRAELLWAKCLAEHNISMGVGRRIIEVAAQAYPDSSIAKKITFGKTKASKLIKMFAGELHAKEEKAILNKKKKNAKNQELQGVTKKKINTVTTSSFELNHTMVPKPSRVQHIVLLRGPNGDYQN